MNHRMKIENVLKRRRMLAVASDTGSVRRRDLDDGDSGAVLVLGQFLGDVDDQPDPRRPSRL